eukprot:9473495-Pyramimonas_sp.AAC.1
MPSPTARLQHELVCSKAFHPALGCCEQHSRFRTGVPRALRPPSRLSLNLTKTKSSSDQSDCQEWGSV